MPPGFRPLASAVAAAHVVDQITLAALPLVLTAAGASARTIGLVVAAQSAGWLIVSLPAGVLADRFSRRSLMLCGAALLFAGALIGGWGTANPYVLALSGFLVSAGVVLQVLSVFAQLPGIAVGHDLARANATLEFARASAALLAPLGVAAALANGKPWLVFAFAIVAACLAFAASWRVPAAPPSTAPRVGMLAAIAEGARFVRDEPVLRAIALCAIAWNAAFFALTAVLAPFAIREVGLGVADVGWGWSIYGVGLLLGALVAPTALRTVSVGVLFVLGPASSACGAVLLAWFTPSLGWGPMAVGLFLIGFGPMIWLVLQTSVRQQLTPPHLLGRVGATITTAIYGVRPIGALLAGLVAAAAGPVVAVWLAAGLFVLSLLAIAASPAPRLRAMPQRAT